MKAFTLFRLALAAAAAVTIAACTPDGGLIYSTIETETQVTDNSLSNTLTVADIAVPATARITWPRAPFTRGS